MKVISDGWTDSLPAYDPHFKRTVDVGFIGRPGELRVLVGGVVFLVKISENMPIGVNFDDPES